MNKKQAFIDFIEKEIFEVEAETGVFSENYLSSHSMEEWQAIMSYWNDFVNAKESKSVEITENGLKILSFMQENEDKYNNTFTAKNIGEGIFSSSRSVSGAMRKLITDGYTEKIVSNPVCYNLTEKGRTYNA